MAGAVIIVVVLLLIPVHGADERRRRVGASSARRMEQRRRRAQRGQRAARPRRLSRRAPPRRLDGDADRGHLPLRHRAGADGPAAARRPPHAGRAAGRRRPDDHGRRPRRAGGAAGLRRRARAGVHLRRPPPLPVVRAGGADRGVDPVRPRRRRVEHLRRVVAGGRRRRLRRERGAALDRRPRRAAGGGRRRVRQRRHGRQPQRAAGRPVALAPAGRRRPRPHPWPAASRPAAPTRRSPRRPGRWTPTCVRGPGRRRGPPDPGRRWRRPSPGSTTTTGERLFAVVATCGTTNAGVIDDLTAVADAAAELDTWMHVDGAYGGAALAAPSVRDRFAGVEAADSFIVDPHKWLFAPFDSCALLYRDPEIGRQAHTQHAEYLDVLHARPRRPRPGGPGVERLRLRPPPVPPGPRPAAVVQPGDPRHAGLHRRRRDDAARRPRGRRAGAGGAAPRADPGARAVDRAVPPHRLGRRRLLGVERLAAGQPAVVRDADGVGRRDRPALVHRQPADDRRRPRRHRRQPGRGPGPMADVRRRPADLVIANARCVATMDGERRELDGGWVAITDGLVSAVGDGPAPAGDHASSTPPTAW